VLGIYRDRALLNGGYDANDDYVLYVLGEGTVRLAGTYAFLDEDGQRIRKPLVAMRSGRVYLLSGTALYVIDLGELPAA
jgi:hypothetical protein